MNRRGISRIAIAVIAVIIIAVAAFGGIYYASIQPATTSGPIKIGMVATLTGTEAWIGFDGLNGAELAVEQINQAGGINGRTIQLIYYDDGGTPEGAVTLSRKLIQDDHVVAGILNHGSDLAIAAAGIFNELKEPALVPWAGHPDIVKGGYIFRVGLSATAPGKAMAYYAYSVLGARKFASIVTVDPYEEAYANAMKAEFTTLGGTVVYDKLVEWGEAEYTSMLTAVKATGADVIMGPHDFSMSIPFVSQARGLGITAPMMFGSSSNTPEFLAGVKDVATTGGGLYVLSYLVFDDPSTAAYATTYEARYGKAPGPTSSYTTYDCIKILAKVIGDVGTDPAKITDGIKALTNYTGVGGTINSYTQGEAIKPIPIYTIQNDTFHLAMLITDPQYTSPF